MSQPGIGAMLHMLGGGSQRSAEEFYGRKIVGAEMVKADEKSSRYDEKGTDGLILAFDDGQKIRIWDNGQSCCESRYMATDDDLAKIVGGKLTRIEVREGPTIGDRMECEVHEVEFLEIGTDECFVTVATHNEHNGYYGGFGLEITLLSTE
jgi:hypothetical protein